ncbi:Pyridoxal-phosphate dependent enzyme [uncultured archaeon]|nr:Pyridoxal-phosphate dependent enzyme [uncultured archaeon]
MTLTKEEEKIYNSIKIGSENDPNNPEFPPEAPKFPATPTVKIEVPGFTNVWLKDESYNPTGTHKDRLAWEIVVTYKQFLESKLRGVVKEKLPEMSIISSGSAAIAIQSMLKKYNLPALRVLVDVNINKEVLKKLKEIGCKIYKTKLNKESLEWKDILRLTKNKKGFDITSSEALDPTTRFYDWLSYEIINESPEYCFVPFGTGNLYENILNVNKKEVSSENHDPRFKGDIKILKKCNFMGATTNNPKSKAAIKLYSPHLPFSHYDEQWIRLYRYAGYCGPESNVILIKERFLNEAISLANRNKIEFEPSGIAGLALLLQLKEKIPKNARVLVVNTGKAKIENPKTL